jgi:hypothetical protein
MHGASNRGKKKTQNKISKFIYMKRERDERAYETLVAGERARDLR